MELIKKAITKSWRSWDWKPLWVTAVIYIVGLIVFIALGINKTIAFNVAAGWSLGFMFAIIGYVILIGSCWIVQFSLNSYMFYFCFILRMLMYAIAILIFATHPHLYSIFTIIAGMVLVHFGIYLTRVLFPKQHSTKFKSIFNHVHTSK